MIIKLELKPTDRQLREFGWIALVAFGLLGALSFVRGGLLGLHFAEATRPVSYALWALGACSALFSCVLPRANRPLFVLLGLVAFPIGLLVSYALLGLLFFGVLTPIALLFRLIGRDRLERKLEPGRESYWVDIERRQAAEDYFSQY